tara:strand:+ start:46308 stop:46559 length:252 start_codon:yes stop_codon:yes gene_type:complete
MKNLTKPQKVLLLLLYGLIILMIIFSFGATKNLGQKGYDQCVQKKCDTKGNEYCQKYRELNNCCLGAGGNIAQDAGKLVCIFS